MVTIALACLVLVRACAKHNPRGAYLAEPPHKVDKPGDSGRHLHDSSKRREDEEDRHDNLNEHPPVEVGTRHQPVRILCILCILLTLHRIAVVAIR